MFSFETFRTFHIQPGSDSNWSFHTVDIEIEFSIFCEFLKKSMKSVSLSKIQRLDVIKYKMGIPKLDDYFKSDQNIARTDDEMK